MADKTKTPEREARLKAALRDNLRRRKAAARKDASAETVQPGKDGPTKT